MSTILAPTDEKIFNGLSAFVKKHLGGATPASGVITVRGFVGRVSKPKGPDYVLITVMTQVPTGTNSHEYDPNAGTVAVNRPTQQSVQIDCYGKKSEAWAKTLAILLRDEIAYAFLQEYGFAPLFVENALDLTQADGREDFARRWMVGCMVHGLTTVTTDQDFFDGATMEIRRV